MRPELQPALDAARTLAPAELPNLLGELEEIRATALARLSTRAVPTIPDELVPVAEAARRLGMSRSYLYHHAKDKFKDLTKREGRKVLFSSKAIEQYISRSRR